MSSFDWRDFLRLADQLRSASAGALGEARYRSAASRAYYAVFNLCRETASRTGWMPTRTAADHERLVQWLRRERKQYLLARQLLELRAERNQADYDPGDRGTTWWTWEQRADRSVRMARQILADLERLLPDG